MYINLVAQLVSFIVSFFISFFVSPLIVKNVGRETYGFLGIANNFTSYITIITVALNSLAGRFVTVNFHQKKYQDANEYFSSVFFSDLIIIGILFIPITIFICFVDAFLQIPEGALRTVQITFALVFAGFMLNLVTSTFSVATFATNKIYLASIRTIEGNLLRLTVIGITFFVFSPRIEFVSLAMLVYYIFVAMTNVVYTKKLLPEIKIRKSYYRIQKVKELIFSGCWSSITALSNVLLEGLDLLITNTMIGAGEMGIVSIVKTVPNMINQCMGSVLSVFTPQLTIFYAKGEIEKMVSYLDYACKAVGCFMALPLAFVIVFGQAFFHLWMPTENAMELWILSLFSLGSLIFAGSVVIMYNLFTVSNNLKKPAFATLISGVTNTVCVLVALKFTNLGIYAVVGISGLIALGRNLLFNIPYAARSVNVSAVRFYKIAFRSAIFVLITSIVGALINRVVMIDSWFMLIFAVVLMCLISILVIILVFFSRNERKELVELISKIIKKNKTI